MQEIKCPKCGEVFQVDEAGYAAIVKQVRDKEFQKELAERQQQFLLDKENSVRLAQAESLSSVNAAASAGAGASSSGMKSPRWLSSSSPIGVSRDTGS